MKVAEKRTKDIIYLVWPSDVKDVVDLHLKKGYCHSGKPRWIKGDEVSKRSPPVIAYQEQIGYNRKENI